MKAKCFIIISYIIIKGDDYFLGGLQLLNCTVKTLPKLSLFWGREKDKGIVFTGGI